VSLGHRYNTLYTHRESEFALPGHSMTELQTLKQYKYNKLLGINQVLQKIILLTMQMFQLFKMINKQKVFTKVIEMNSCRAWVKRD
jgi:hypothetical protein